MAREKISVPSCARARNAQFAVRFQDLAIGQAEYYAMSTSFHWQFKAGAILQHREGPI